MKINQFKRNLKLQKLFQAQVQLKKMNQRDYLSTKDIVKLVKNQTLKIPLTSKKLIEKKKPDAIEDKSKNLPVSSTKKQVLDQMMKRKTTL